MIIIHEMVIALPCSLCPCVPSMVTWLCVPSMFTIGSVVLRLAKFLIHAAVPPGGDHLIPWSSSSLLAPHALPVKAVRQAAASAADSTTQQLQLPVLGIWATKPLVVEQNVPPTHSCLQQPQQQQQQEQTGMDNECSAATTSATRGTSDTIQSRQGTKELAVRLTQLQQFPWRRFHVVWPRLCLGSSHCNIQVRKVSGCSPGGWSLAAALQCSGHWLQQVGFRSTGSNDTASKSLGNCLDDLHQCTHNLCERNVTADKGRYSA